MQYKKKLFVHISTAMLVIVFLVSVATYLYETLHIEEHIQEKVISISTLLSQEYMHLHKQKSKYMLMKKIKDPEFVIEDKNIHLFNISDKNGNVIIDKISAEYEKIKIQIEKYKHDWIIKDRNNTKIILIHNPEIKKYYVDIVMPLKIINNKNETVHSLYDATNDINNINSKLYKNIIAVVVIGILSFLAVYPTVLSLQNSLLAKTKALSKTNIEILNLLGSVIAKRDSDTYVHNHRVALYALTLGERLGLSKDNLRSLIKGSFLHDIGKVGIRDNILLKPGKLTYDEFEIMKQHVNLGKDIISYSEQLEDAKSIVYSHHEKYDGSGYPEGLVGNG